MVSRSAIAIMRLTARDCTLVGLLGELRYLTVSQIQQTCFHKASARTTSHRLTCLRRRRLLDCLTHRTFEDRRAFWCLAPLGRSVAATLAGASLPAPRVDAVAALHMDHVIATNQVFCDLCALHRAGRLGAFRWHGSQHAGIDIDDTRVVPDAVILTARPDGAVWMYCLELDRGTMGPAALNAKFHRYRFLYRVAARREHEPQWQIWGSSWVLFASNDRPRAALAAEMATACGLERFWAGTRAELPAGLAESIGPESGGPPDLPWGPPGGVVPPVLPDGMGEPR
jgi:Replication-relaxation